MVGGNGDFLHKDKYQHARTAVVSAPTLQQATVNPHLCRRLLDSPRQVWLSLLWGHCSFLLGLGVHKVLSFPPRVGFCSLVEVL